MLAYDGRDAFYVRTHFMLTLMEGVATWVAAITILAGTDGASEDASRPMGGIACIHRCKTATVLATLAP